MRWGGIFDIDGKRKQIALREEEAAQESFWNDSVAAEKQLRVTAQLKSWVKEFERVADLYEELEIALDLAREGGVSERDLT